MAKTTDYKEGKALIKVVYFTSKTLADGSHPFLVRITKDRRRTYLSTGLSLFPKYWNEAKGNSYNEAIRRSYPEPGRNNLITALEKWERKYSEAADTLASADEQHDTKTVIRKAIEGRKQLRRSKLLAYIDELTANMKRAGQLGNMSIYQILRNGLSDFIRSEYEQEDVRFADVSVKFCNDFETYLRERGNAETTLSNRFRTLRSVLNKAISEGVAATDTYPFSRSSSDQHKFKISKFDTSTQKRAINRNDIRKIEAFEPVGTATGAYAEIKNRAEVARLQRAKDVFIFSFYAGGINFVDLTQLRWRNVSTDHEGNKRLNYVRQKTGGKFSLLLLPPAVTIIEQYRPFTHNGPNSYIFDILNTSVHLNAKSVTNRLKKTLGQVNGDLKTIGERVGIETPLTTYVARHTMATSLRRLGIADAVTGQMMGHKDARVTAVYLDSFASETVDSAMSTLL